MCWILRCLITITISFISFLTMKSQTFELNLTTSPEFSPCADEVLLAFELQNIDASAFDNVGIGLDLPPGISYVPGSNVNIEILDESNTNHPIFNISNVSSFSINTFYIELISDCELQSTGNSILATLNFGDNTEEQVIIDNISIRVPTLTLITSENMTYSGSVSETYTRSLTLNNAGFGEIYNIYIVTDYAENGLEFISSNIIGDMVILPNGEQAYRIGASFYNTFGDANGVYNNEDGILFYEETVRIINCQDASSSIRVFFGCDDEICEVNPIIEPTILTVAEGTSAIEWSLTDSNTPGFCSPGFIQVEIENTGTAIARDIILEPGINYYGNDYQPAVDDCLTLTGFMIGAATLVADTDSYTGYGLDLAQLSSNPNGSGGLSDEDGDGIYNDLLPGESVILNIDVNLLDSCMQSSTFFLRFFGMEVSFNLGCVDNVGESFYKRDLDFLMNAGYPDVDDNLYLEYEDSSIIDLNLDFDRDSENRFFDACQNTGETEYFIILPGILDFPADFEVEVNDVVAPYEIRGDTVIVIAEGYEAFIEMNLLVVCVVAQNPNAEYCPLSGGLPEVHNIEYFANYYCDPDNCDAFFQLYNGQTDDFVVDCESPPAGSSGVVTTDFIAERQTLGWTDSSLAEKVNPDNPNLRLDRTYVHDLVKLTIPGVAVGDGQFDTTYLELTHYSGSMNYPHYNVLADTIHFFDTESNQWATCTNVPFDSIIIEGGIYIHNYNLRPLFEAGGCLEGMHFTSGDSIRFEIMIQISPNAYHSLRQIPFFQAGFTYQIDGNLLDCGKHGTLLSKANPFAGVQRDVHYSEFSCDTITAAYNLYQASDRANNYDVFPDEFRPYAVYDSVVSQVSMDIDFVPGSAMIVYQYYDTISFLIEEDTVFIDDPVVTIDGEDKYLHFSDSTPFPIVDVLKRETRNELIFQLIPSCASKSRKIIRTDVFWERFHYAQELGSSIKHEYGYSHSSAYYEPEIELDVVVHEYSGSSDTAIWLIELCNDHAYGNYTEAIAHNWLALDVSGLNILPLFVQDFINNQKEYAFAELDSSGVYWAQIDTLYGDECRIFEIAALIGDCDTTSIPLSMGYTCHNYPVHPDTAYLSCEDTRLIDSLFVIPRPAFLDIDLTEEPEGETYMCDAVNYELSIINGQIGSADNVNVILRINQGTSIVPGSSMLRLGNGTYITIPDPAVFEEGTYIWYLSDYPDSPIADMELPGVLNAPNNQLYLSYQLETNCEYRPESTISYAVNWENACGNTAKSSPYFYGQPLDIQGAPERLNDYNTQVVQANLNTCTGTLPLQVMVTNEGSENSLTVDGEYVRVQIPPGMSYEDGSYQAIENMPGNPAISLVTEDSIKWLEVPFLIGVDVGETMIFTIDLSFEATQLDSCALYPVLIETRQYIEVPCATAPNGNCDLSFLSSKGSFIYEINKNQLEWSMISTSASPAPPTNEAWVLEMALINQADYSASGFLEGDIFLDIDDNGVFDENIDSLLFGVFNWAEGLAAGDSLDWEIWLLMHGAHTCHGVHLVLNDEENCLCDPVSFYIAPPTLQNAGENLSLCNGEMTTLGSEQIAGYSYNWMPTAQLGDPNSSTTTFLNENVVALGEEISLNYELENNKSGRLYIK